LRQRLSCIVHYLIAATATAVEQRRFAPALSNGKPLDSNVMANFRFHSPDLKIAVKDQKVSRDFELLQRIEKELGLGPYARDSFGDPVRMPRQRTPPEIPEEKTATASLLASSLAPGVRSELSKLILATFLSTSSVKTAMFTGVEAGDGAKWIAACTAEVLSQSTCHRVCLLDADLSLPTLHRYFSVANETGLAAVLERGCSIPRATKCVGENLWLLPAGMKRLNWQRIAAMFQESIVELLGSFDYLVICGPDSGHLADLAVIGSATEGAILVLDAQSTRRVAAQQAKLGLQAAKIRILGSVFNNQNFPVPEFLSSRL
jgi:Mrp family chromosome partitioning ATPase